MSRNGHILTRPHGRAFFGTLKTTRCTQSETYFKGLTKTERRYFVLIVTL